MAVCEEEADITVLAECEENVSPVSQCENRRAGTELPPLNSADWKKKKKFRSFRSCGS